MTTRESIGVGMLGYAFMEADALHAPLSPRLVSLSGRTADRVEAAREELGWAEAVTEVHHLLTAVPGEGAVAPHGATFEDGYRCAEVREAIVRSAESGRRGEITYRGADG